MTQVQDFETITSSRFFAALGLHNTATGTFESDAVDPTKAAQQLSLVLNAIANPSQFSDVDKKAALKHLWIYIDRVDESDADEDTNA